MKANMNGIKERKKEVKLIKIGEIFENKQGGLKKL